MPKNILALGLDPVFADFTQFPELTPERITAFIDSQLERLRGLGYEVESCLCRSRAALGLILPRDVRWGRAQRPGDYHGLRGQRRISCLHAISAQRQL